MARITEQSIEQVRQAADIIEVVSGETYADFIQKHIFDTLGMTSSSYGSMTNIVPNRASGYSFCKEALQSRLLTLSCDLESS